MKIESHDTVCPGGLPAYLTWPQGRGPYPIVILMHERYGLVAHTRDLARRCAADGYMVMAPNFFYRHKDQNALNLGTSRYDMTDTEAVEYLSQALAALEMSPVADLHRVAIAGYCQTGRHPLIFASEVKITAAVVWYGAASKREWDASPSQPRPLDEVIAKIDCPVFGAFGSDDHIISVDDVRRFRDSLETHRKSFEIRLYEGAPHGWLNDHMPGRYRKPQADAAWSAQQRFLRDVFAGNWKRTTVRWLYACEFGADYDFSKNRRQE